MKIVSYKQNISGVDIAIQSDILWPCHTFNITVPVQKERDLNIFEETVLKMIDIETSETAKLVELLSLKVELIQFLKSRLVELGLIDERFNLTSDGINLLEKLDKEEENYEIVTLFINLVSGEILPVVIQKLETIKDYEVEGNKVNFKIGSSGNTRKIRANKIICDSKYKSRKVSNADVIQTVNTFRRLYNRFSSSLSSKINLPKFARNMGSITINETAEEVYLHCKVLIQKGHSDFLVTDPFGFDFSSQLTKDIQNDNNDKWLKTLRAKAESKKLKNNGDDSNDEWINNIFAIDELKKYWNIIRHLKNVEENHQKSKEKTKDLDNEQKIKNTQSRMVQSLYEVMESVFKQIENDYPSEMVYKEMFASQSSKTNQEMLENFAKKVGFNIPMYGSFLNLQPNMISSLDKGIVRPEAMVALALSRAKEDENHPFHILAKNVPKFLLYIKKLQGYRNSVAHGSELDIKIFKTVSYRCRSCSIELDTKVERATCEKCNGSLEKITEFEKLKEIIYLSLESLYPAFFLKEKKVDRGFTQKVELPNQEVLKAKKGLDKNFSLILIKNLKENQNLYEQLIKIEMAKLNLEKYASVYINSIYSVLQILLDEHNSHIYKELKLETIRGVALKNANSTNFKLPNKQWTDELVHVSKKMIKNASEGKPSSLGASLLVLLAFETSDKLGNIKLKVPNLIEIISLVLKLRGHGDNSSLEIIEEIGSKKQLIDLKKSIYKIIKTMKEL